MKTRANPELYAKLTEPRSRAEVDAAMAAFDEDLYALREKHGIPDLLVVWGVSIDGAGVEVGSGYYGNTALALQVAAAGLAIWRQRAHQDVERTVDAMLETKPKRAKKKSPAK